MTNFTETDIAIDLGWLMLLQGEQWQQTNELFCGSVIKNASSDKKQQLFFKVLQRREIRDLLMLLEQIVIADSLVVDKAAANRMQVSLPEGLKGIVRLETPPIDVYKKTYDAVQEIKREIREENVAEERIKLEKLTLLGADDPFWSGTEKEFHDELDRSFQGKIGSVADSQDSLGRAIFYLEFGHYLGHVPFLSAGKRHWLTVFKQALVPPLHEKIVKMFDAQIQRELELHLCEVLAEETVDTPPVAELILRESINKQRPMLDIAIELRETKHSIDYRELLRSIRAALRQGRSGRIEAEQAIRGLSRIAFLWGTHLDLQMGLTRTERVLKFDQMPIIGGLLKAASMDTVKLRDFLFETPPGYLVFIASWYSPYC